MSVLVVAAVNCIVCHPESHLKSLKVLLPNIFIVPLSELFIQKLLKVIPPPENDLVPVVAAVIFIVEVPALNVRLVVIAVDHDVDCVPFNVHVPDPIVIDL